MRKKEEKTNEIKSKKVRGRGIGGKSTVEEKSWRKKV